MKFSEVMDTLPFPKLWELVNNPGPIDKVSFTCMAAWMGFTWVSTSKFSDIALQTGVCESMSDIRRKIKDKCLYFNGRAINKPDDVVEMISPGWGIIKVGKRKFHLVLMVKE